MDKELEEMFNSAYCHSYTSSDSINAPENPNKARKVTSKKYSEFLEKYENLEKYIDTFKSPDLVYFFREKSRDNGNFYTIRNMRRDMGIFKRLLLDYSAVEICTMIEFLFESGQKYLPTVDLQPTVLASAWCVRIYSDMLSWVDGTFNAETNSYKKLSESERRNTEREWHSHKVKMGDWGD